MNRWFRWNKVQIFLKGYISCMKCNLCLIIDIESIKIDFNLMLNWNLLKSRRRLAAVYYHVLNWATLISDRFLIQLDLSITVLVLIIAQNWILGYGMAKFGTQYFNVPVSLFIPWAHELRKCLKNIDEKCVWKLFSDWCRTIRFWIFRWWL